jgi:hypothetical protein
MINFSTEFITSTRPYAYCVYCYMRIQYTINDADFKRKDRNLDITIGNRGRGVGVSVPAFS